MDLIFTNAKKVDQGVLLAYSLDMSFGEDVNENDFELTIGSTETMLEDNSVIYIEGTEYGGIVDGMKSNTASETLTHIGRTWHGILNSKVIQPDEKKVENARGSVVSFQNENEASISDLKLYGRTSQNGIPSPESPVALETVGDDGSVTVMVCGKNLLKNILKTETYGGITYAVSDDGIITLNGTSTGSWRNIQTSIYLEAGKTYTMSGVQKGGTTSTYYVYLEDAEKVRYIDTGNGVSFTPKVSGNGYVCAVVSKNAAVSNVKICPQIELGSTATAYEPYKEQTLPIPTPNGLPGIPVSSGGNYTDENGQQWICDEVDFEKGVYVQRVAETTLTANDNWIKSAVTHLDRFVVPLGSVQCIVDAGLCTSYIVGVTSQTIGRAYLDNGTGVARLIVNHSEYGKNDLNSFKASIPSDGIKVLWVLLNPVETALSAEELAQYAALHTYQPNTTISNDGMADMEITFTIADSHHIVSGDANEILSALIDRLGLSGLFVAAESLSGINIAGYKFSRYCKGYDGIRAMLAANGAKLKIRWEKRSVVISAEPIADYTASPVDGDVAPLTVERHGNKVNHLICLGRGELAEREVIHLYVDQFGRIGDYQAFTGLDEVMDVFDYSNAESLDELRKGGIERLKELRDNDKIEVSINEGNDITYDICDIIAATDTKTKNTANATVIQKIVKINNGTISIEYKTGR